jgi:small-conductance mechanosensitive channel
VLRPGPSFNDPGCVSQPHSIPVPGQTPAAADTLNAVLERVVEAVSTTGVRQGLFLTAVTIVVLWVLRWGTLRVVHRRVEDPRTIYQWRKVTGYVGFGLGLWFVGFIWLDAMASLGTFLGLTTAGLAIALRDLVTGFAAWIFIVWRRPFELGDRIQIGTHAGDVVDIRLFAFTVLEIGNWVASDQSTGRLIHIPNSRVFTEPLSNYTDEFPYIWNEVPVLITFESDWRRAKRILGEIAEAEVGPMARAAEDRSRRRPHRFLIHYQRLGPTVYTSVRDSGVLLTIRHLVLPRKRRGVTEGLWEAVLDAFAQEPTIALAYPTTRFYTAGSADLEARSDGRQEGVPGDGPSVPLPGSSELASGESPRGTFRGRDDETGGD